MDRQAPSLAIQRSSMLNGINRVGGFMRFLGANPFRIRGEAIIAKATKQAQYEGAIPAQVKEGLAQLIPSIYNQAAPNPFGELAVKKLLERTVYGRLRVEQFLVAHPEIVQVPIVEPVFIIGMPRTGTTILHAMMNEDPAHRSPLAWECLLPYPVPSRDNYTDNDQLNTVRKEFAQLFKLVPDFQKKHHMTAESPQECIGINAFDINSFQISAQLYVPDYMEWFAHQADRRGTMGWHKRFLQYLQSGGVSGERWLLKSPVHLMRLPELFEVYPDAKIIMTHRDPTQVVPSAASLISSVRSLYSDAEDPHRTGAEQCDTWSEYFERFLKCRSKLNKENQIIDLKFEDFIDDQVGSVAKIYEKFGWDLTPDAVSRFQDFLAKNPKGKHGSHTYSPEDFGLTDAGIRFQFSKYIQFLENI